MEHSRPWRHLQKIRHALHIKMGNGAMRHRPAIPANSPESRMGHITARLEYEKLRAKVDRFPVGTPATATVYEILKTLYTPEEAELAAQLPLKFSTLGALSRRLKIPEDQLRARLDPLCDKGLVMDLILGGKRRYVIMPAMVGFFEFSMMRRREDMDQHKLGELYHRLMLEEDDFVAQFHSGAPTNIFQTLVHEESLPDTYSEILDWERAEHQVREAGAWSVSNCHCRHVAHHKGHDCEQFPMEDVCLTLGRTTEYFVRRGMAKAIEMEEALDLLARSRDAGLVHIGDNVQRRPTFICNCCSCCCEILGSYKRFAVFDNNFSSNFEARVDPTRCTGCKKCQQACPVDAIDMVDSERRVGKKKVRRLSVVDHDVCIGCGVCQLACRFDSMEMAPRSQRKLAPENFVARMLTMAIEQGKLPELMIDVDEGVGARAASVLLGAFLKLPPASILLANDVFKSRFVSALMTSTRLLARPKPKR
jgi:NAD-dependent dihydropyrimidine dehydrogenase PreA subunit